MCNDLPKALQTARQYAETLESWLVQCQSLLNDMAKETAIPYESHMASLRVQNLKQMGKKLRQISSELNTYEEIYTR